MKYLILFLILSFSTAGYLHAQDTDKIVDFAAVEVLPEFPNGGPAAFAKFFSKNYKYPEIARSQGIGGMLILSLIVEKDGSLTDIKILRDSGFGTGQEAARVLKESPKWKPGMQNGKAVRVIYKLPIKLS